MPVFRKAVESDVRKIAELEKKIFSDAWTEKSICETFCQPHVFITVAEDAREIQGYCILYSVIDEGEIARIAVDFRHQRKGVGRNLLDYTCDLCRKNKVIRLMLDVRESNEGAKAFYTSYGFEKDGIRKDFYRNPTEHAILMSKKLDSN